jgi:choice-of-anchor A domain-containing protein
MPMKTRLTALTAAVLALVLASSAHAAPTAPLTGLQVLQQFNQVSLGNAQSSSETIGRAWVGGNVNGGQYSMSSTLPTSNYAGLTVLGNASNNFHGESMGVVINGNATNGVVKGAGASYVGGNSKGVNYDNQAQIVGSLAGNLNKGGSAGSLADSGSHVNGAMTQASANYIATTRAASSSTNFGTVLGDMSTSLSHVKGNSVVTFDSQGAIFNAKPVNGVAVFDLTALANPLNLSDKRQLDDLVFGSSSIKFNLNGATTVIINSDNKSISTNANFSNAQALGSKLLWNLYDATSVSIGTQWGGSVLATDASFTNRNSIEGGVYAASFLQSGEIHQVAFGGVIPVAAVPEPETYAMLMAGLGLVGFMSRRSRRRKQRAAAR